jgi:hypothetical protein
MPLSGRGMKLQAVSESFILIGLDNGTIAGWDLTKNYKTDGLDNLYVHNQCITHLQMNHSLVFIGTAQG